MNDICNGRQGITAAIELRLGRFFDVDPQWFMNMQSNMTCTCKLSDLSANSPRSNRAARRECGERESPKHMPFIPGAPREQNPMADRADASCH
jgi:plasmid maintenance system antidote protein VapI